jgi:hypothetical protein
LWPEECAAALLLPERTACCACGGARRARQRLKDDMAFLSAAA